MKKLLLGLLVVLGMPAIAQKKAPKPEAASGEINWISIQEAEQRMKTKPKKILIDVYTSWCGWCKVMDKKTYSNPKVVSYINDNFYAIKLDAETKDSIQFQGQKFGYKQEYKANMLAVQMLNGQMAYPTTVIMEEGFRNPMPLQGYLEVGNMEMVLKYVGEKIYKHTQFDEYQKSFKASW